MKKIYITLFLILLLGSGVFAQENGLQSVQISPADTALTVGDSILYTSVVTDTSGAVVDTAVTWSVSGTFGSISQSGLFSADSAGSGFVIAALGSLVDSASVTVAEIPGPVVINSIEISPPNESVTLGDSLQFTAEVRNSDGVEVDTSVTWSVVDTLVGVISETGLFSPLTEGSTQVTATLGDISDTTNVTVGLPTDPNVNTISFFRMKNGKLTKLGGAIAEGGTKTIAGLQHPLNFLNGSKLFFPENSLSDDIIITMILPKFAKDNGPGSDVTFGDSIAFGITFEVSVNDSVISPFFFDIPLELTIPLKKGLLNNLGIDPANLGMFFVTDSGALDSTGITDVTVNDKGNRITANVAHFSDIAAAPKTPSILTSVEEEDQSRLPDDFKLNQNYPNPFNPVTKITYSVGVTSRVSITIFNLLGQEVRTIVDKVHTKGNFEVTWDARDNFGNPVSTGVYIFQLRSDGFVTGKRMILIR